MHAIFHHVQSFPHLGARRVSGAMQFAGFGFCFRGGISVSFMPTHSSSTAENDQPGPPVINVPVDFTEADKEEIVNCTVIPDEGTKQSQRAAVLLQSWYRGYLVRRTQPLVQLREIHEVKSELGELRAQVSDVDFIKRAQQDPKTRVWLTESVMSLLLRLDAVQGSHPFVREIRKATTREVVDFQDAIDAAFTLGH